MSGMNPKTLLDVEHLRVEFPRKNDTPFVAVGDVSFRVREGEIVALVGESGSGKSTAANCITHTVDPVSGSISFDGNDITHANFKQGRTLRAGIQMVFQNPRGSFDPRRSLGYSICEGLRNRGVSKADALEKAGMLMERCGLSRELLDRYPHEVSGGQCQRAAIARALATDPKLLIADEATSALDVTVQAEVAQLFTDLCHERNMALLFICHDLALVQGLADSVVVMQKGRVVESGPVEQVLYDPQKEYTKLLLEAAL